jgi:hypothetical protein
LATQQDDNRISLGRNKSQDKHVPHTTRVAFENGLTERTIFVEGNFLVLGSHQMIHDVRARGVSSAIAEPFLANVAHHHAAGVVDAAVATCVMRKILELVVNWVLKCVLNFIYMIREN